MTDVELSPGLEGLGRDEEATQQKEATNHAARFPTSARQDIEIGIRPAQADDINYVKHTWLDAYRRGGGVFHNHVDPELYRRSHRAIIATIMEEHTTLIAYDPADPRIIMGFLCGDNYPTAPVVHFVYVPSKLRGWGIAKSLMQRLGWHEGRPIIASHMTTDGFSVNNHLVIYNPYFMFHDHRSLLHGKTTPRQPDERVKYTHTSELYRKKRRARPSTDATDTGGRGE